MSRIWKELLFIAVLIVCIPSGVIAGNVRENNVDASTEAELARNEVSTDSDFNWDRVINALIQVESGGNPRAKSGASVGVLQITPVLVAECNNILKRRGSKKRFKLSDRLSVEKSKEMFRVIQSFHNPMHNVEKAIRSWNGGMHYSVKRTQRYFNKVMAAMKK